MTSLIFFPGSQHENSSIATECTKCYQTKGAAQIARELMPAGKGHLRDGNGEASLGPYALQDHSHRRPCCPPSVMSIGVRAGVRVPVGRSSTSSMTADILRRIVAVMEQHCHST